MFDMHLKSSSNYPVKITTFPNLNLAHHLLKIRLCNSCESFSVWLLFINWSLEVLLCPLTFGVCHHTMTHTTVQVVPTECFISVHYK